MKISSKLALALLIVMLLTVALVSCGNSDLSLVSDGNSEYVIVRAQDSSNTIFSAASKLRNAINSKFDTEIEVIDDSKEADGGLEIVIGETNRTTKKEIDPLKEGDYSIFPDGDRLVFMGGSDNAVYDAVLYFIENQIKEQEEGLVIDADYLYEARNEYKIGQLTIGSNSFGDYSVIIPKEADDYEVYAAEFFVDYIKEKVGYNLEVLTDDVEETELEILIGSTNRSKSKQAYETELDDIEYILSFTDDKLVIAGNAFAVAGGVSEIINKHLEGAESKDIKLNIDSAYTPKKIEFEEADSVILMIGDGMGFNQIEITELDGLGKFSGSYLPNKGSSTTDSLSGTTDSGAAGTALATGYKTQNSRLGMDGKLNPVMNVRELAESKGAMTGVITTDYIHGATPGAFLVHLPNRNDTEKVKKQIDELDVDYLGSYVGDNLLSNLQECLNDFSEAETFFLMLEESTIDPAGHANNKDAVITAVKRFDDSIKYAMVFTVLNPDTVLIITADHETGGLTKKDDGTFEFTTGGHSSAPVPVFAIGDGTEIFNDKTVDNIDIPKFIASVYGETEFGE